MSVNKETIIPEFSLCEKGNINCIKHDIYDIALDKFTDKISLKERLNLFTRYKNNFYDNFLDCYGRPSLTGSGTVINLKNETDQGSDEYINLFSNDYLNLTQHPRVLKKGKEAIDKYGAGAGSVPLLGGTFDIHNELAKKIAKFKGCEKALIHTSGFASNYSTLSALLKSRDVAIVDRYIHASLAEGCRHSNIVPFKHNNVESLKLVLEHTKDKYLNKIIVLDGVYSMDGDIAKLPEIVALAKEYGALVAVDEAHASGVIGTQGKGTPSHFNLDGKIDIVLGTFSKALGGVGGFVAGSAELIDYLKFTSKAYIFSTGMPPSTAAALCESIDVIQSEPELMHKLWENINYFKSGLLHLGFDIGNSETAIFPIILGEIEKVYRAVEFLHHRKICVAPVLYPAVPRKLSRIRLSITAGLDRTQLDRILNALEDMKKVL